MAKLAIDRASIVFGKKSGDFHSKSGDREIFIILSKIGRLESSVITNNWIGQVSKQTSSWRIMTKTVNSFGRHGNFANGEKADKKNF